MIRFLVALSLVFLGCNSNKAPYAIIFELENEEPFYFKAMVAHTREKNQKAEIYILAPDALLNTLHVSKTRQFSKQHYSVDSLVKHLKLKHAFLVGLNTIVHDSLENYLEDSRPLEGIVHYSKTVCSDQVLPVNKPSPSKVVKDPINYLIKAPCEYLTGNGIRSSMDHAYDEEGLPFFPERVKHAETVLVKPTLLDHFLAKYHPKIKHSYILVTHLGDQTVPGKHAHLLEDPKVLAWFGINNIDPRVRSIPIGINVDSAMRPRLEGVAHQGAKAGKETVLKAIAEAKFEKDILVYMNFCVRPGERQEVYDTFKDKPYCFTHRPRTYYTEVDQTRYFLELARSKFVLSPHGEGLDCYRTWEALILGAIPIVKTSPLDRLYEGLPVLIVNEWSEVTPKLLEETYEKFHPWKDVEQVTLKYWVNQIKRFKESCA